MGRSSPIDPQGRDPALGVIDAITADRLEPEDVVAWADQCLRDDECGIVCSVNPRSLWVARRDEAYVANLHRMNKVIVDGIGLVWLYNRMTGRNIQRVSFETTSLSPPIFAWCEREGHPVHFIGAKPGVAPRAAAVVREHFPKIRIVAEDHGFLSLDESVARVKASGAKAVLASMGSPRQEEFLVALRDSGWKGVAFICGGYFDQLVYAYVFFPAWIDRLHLRTPLRLTSEPRKLIPRLLVEYRHFYLMGMKAMLSRQRPRNNS